ncbi:hypothetical protein F4806DRAFT_338909 [Annulohypoxylon nitens]|nr:hypothetical protein F4806DRAFT_338909 [Annulohypoxylon nitens]
MDIHEAQQNGVTGADQLEVENFIQDENKNLSGSTKQPNEPIIIREKDPPKVTPLKNLTETPAWIDCPFCNKRAMTRASKEGTTMQTVVGCLLCLCCVCLACLPCMCGWLQNTHIYCTSCSIRIATIPLGTYFMKTQLFKGRLCYGKVSNTDYLDDINLYNCGFYQSNDKCGKA